MPRPRKWRRVCEMPNVVSFGPLEKTENRIEIEELIMSVEEFETIRLMDYEGLMQETCAEQMGIARTTVQRIYCEARKKLAKALVLGINIKIEGGDFRLCSTLSETGACPKCKRKKMIEQIEEAKNE